MTLLLAGSDWPSRIVPTFAVREFWKCRPRLGCLAGPDGTFIPCEPLVSSGNAPVSALGTLALVFIAVFSPFLLLD
jgi:hypothetical protein